MTKKFQLGFGVMSVLLLLTTLSLTGCNASLHNPAQTSSIVDKAPDEGVVVHGHWTIEVRNPDGALVEHREFDNGLSGLGAQALASILGRQASVGGWSIQLLGVGFPGRVPDGRTGVAIVESTYPPGTAYNVARTLTLTAPGITDLESQPLRLTGTAIAAVDHTSIIEVETIIGKNSATEAPSNRYGHSAPFTTTHLESPVSLSAGQTVTVTVVITFR